MPLAKEQGGSVQRDDGYGSGAPSPVRSGKSFIPILPLSISGAAIKPDENKLNEALKTGEIKKVHEAIKLGAKLNEDTKDTINEAIKVSKVDDLRFFGAAIYAARINGQKPSDYINDETLELARKSGIKYIIKQVTNFSNGVNPNWDIKKSPLPGTLAFETEYWKRKEIRNKIQAIRNCDVRYVDLVNSPVNVPQRSQSR